SMQVWDMQQVKKVGEFGGPAKVVRWSSDGRFLYTYENGCIVRYKVNGTEFAREEATPPIGDGILPRLELSSDNNWICIPGSNRPAFGPKVGDTTYIFKTTNLSKPEFSAANADGVCFDPQRSRLIKHSRHGQMTVLPLGSAFGKTY